MRAAVQRVRNASVALNGEVVAEIGAGVVVPLGVASCDSVAEVERLAGKAARLRIFENEEGRLDRSLLDVSGEALVVSQFTLIADTRKGNRPSFTGAADPEVAEPCTSTSAQSSSEKACASHEASSARACRSRSSTTARSRSCSRHSWHHIAGGGA